MSKFETFGLTIALSESLTSSVFKFKKIVLFCDINDGDSIKTFMDNKMRNEVIWEENETGFKGAAAEWKHITNFDDLIIEDNNPETPEPVKV